MDLHEKTATEIAGQVASGRTTARAVVDATLSRIAAIDPLLGAFTDVTAERALTKAAAIDASRTRGEPLGPLAGVPFAVKNL